MRVPNEGCGHPGTAVEGSVHQHDVAAGRLAHGGAHVLPFRALAEEVDGSGDVGDALRHLDAHRLEPFAIQTLHLVARERANIERRGLDQVRDAVAEANAGGSERGDVEGTAVREHA
jgi:hypothetical protein